MSSPSSTRRHALSRREILCLGAFALGTFPLGRLFAAAPPIPVAPPDLKAATIGDKLTLISGGGGNVVVFGGEDGALVIDSGLAAVSAGLGAAIGQAAPGPVGILVNTHWHFDHVGGNERLARAGARIVAHDRCLQRLSSDQYIEFFDKKIPAAPAAAWPVFTFAEEATLHLNQESISLHAVPPAHTDGDIIVRFDRANLVHGGDLFFHGLYPFIDYSSGGWLGGMIAGAKRILALTDAKTKIVPGHGPLATQEDLKQYVSFLEAIMERLSGLKTAGKTLDEAVAAAPTKDFDAKLGHGLLVPEAFVKVAYTSLLRHQS